MTEFFLSQQTNLKICLIFTSFEKYFKINPSKFMFANTREKLNGSSMWISVKQISIYLKNVKKDKMS